VLDAFGDPADDFPPLIAGCEITRQSAQRHKLFFVRLELIKKCLLL